MSKVSGKIEFLAFNISETICGINILDIQEITKISDVTEVPRALDYVEGIINLRGKVITIINMGKKLSLKSVEKKSENQVIILSVKDEQIGLMVDDIDTVRQSDITDIGPPPANLKGTHGAFFDGIFQTEDQLIGLLNLKKVLTV